MGRRWRFGEDSRLGLEAYLRIELWFGNPVGHLHA